MYLNNFIILRCIRFFNRLQERPSIVMLLQGIQHYEDKKDYYGYMYFSILITQLLPLYPKNKVKALFFCGAVSFCLLLDQRGEKEALYASCQSFEVAAARTSGLVNLVSSHQTGFLCVSIKLLINRCL